jgi:hypothetical protein
VRVVVVLAEDGPGVNALERAGWRELSESTYGVMVHEHDSDGSNSLIYMIPWSRVVRVVY